MALKELSTYLMESVKKGASDIFLQAGSPVHAKIEGRVIPIDDYRLMPRDTDTFVAQMLKIAGRDKNEFESSRDDDFAFYMPDVARFRANIYHQRGSVGAVIRVVAFNIPDPKEMNIPDSIMQLANFKSGLIIVSGTAGSGKSTTQACLVDRINHSREGHIITIEDPIEFIHKNDKCLVTQREVFIDAKDFDSALRAALREAPDVILLGEMRDFETIRTAITAAETGHLVIATLHTQGAVNSIDRIIDSFPPEQQPQIRLQVSMALNAVVSQKLLPGTDGVLHPAFELMKSNLAVRNLIRECQTFQIANTLSARRTTGMISMDESVLELYENGLISAETAEMNAVNFDTMRSRMQQDSSNGRGQRRR